MSEVRQYRKKPIIIEAIQWDGSQERQREIVTWAHGFVTGWFDDRPYLEVITPAGPTRADIGDWVIKGVEGEFYPCEDSVFEATYETVEEEPT